MEEAGRRLSELRVTELRLQLERRGRDSKGVKAVLQERLQQAIIDEGKNPDEYYFDSPPPVEKRTPTKRASRSDNLPEPDSADETLDEVGPEATEQVPAIEESADKPPSVISESRNSVIKKREAEESLESSEPKKICKEESVAPVEDSSKNSDFNGLDGDDSINIDIGDEDFLNEDGEQGINNKKDESSEAQQGAADPSCQNAGGEVKQSDAEKRDVGADDTVQDDKKQETPPADATGNEDSKSISVRTNPDKEKEDQDVKKSQSASAASRNLWISGLSRFTRATDLKQVCSLHGKVIGAKIVINARSPGSRYYGYVTMSTPENAQSCIKRLHKTELDGRIISVEKAKSETISGSSVRKDVSPNRNRPYRSPRRTSNNRRKLDRNSQEKNIGSSEKDINKDEKSENATESKEGEDSKEKKDKDAASGEESKKKDGSQKGDGQERRRSPRDYIPLEQIIRERYEHRAASMRDWHNRRMPHRGINKPQSHHRPDNYRQRMEMDRIAIERKKLRIERERIEREKLELQRLERERQKLERVRLDVERLELKRAQMRLEEERGRAAAKRNYFMGSGSGVSGMMSRSKDTMPISTYDRSIGRSDANINTPRFTMPPPPYVSMSAPYNMTMGSSVNKPDRVPPPRDRRDFNRDYPPGPRHTGGGSGNPIKYSNNSASYEMRQPLPPGTRPRDQRPTGGNNHPSSRRSPKPGPRDHYSDSSVAIKGDSWSNNVSGPDSGNRYNNSITSSGPYGDSRYPSYQPAPPGIR